MRNRRPHAGNRCRHVSTLPDRRPSVGRGVPPGGLKEGKARRQERMASSQATIAIRCPPKERKTARCRTAPSLRAKERVLGVCSALAHQRRGRRRAEVPAEAEHQVGGGGGGAPHN